MFGAWRVDRTELLSGLVILGLGVLILIESATYSLGQLSSIGPGFFPRALAVILIVCGIGTVLASLSREAPLPEFKWRPLAAVSMSLFFFAFTITGFGLIPAIAGLTILARLSERELSLPAVLMLAFALAILSWLIFVFGLGLPIRAVRWPV